MLLFLDCVINVLTDGVYLAKAHNNLAAFILELAHFLEDVIHISSLLDKFACMLFLAFDRRV